MSRTDKLKQVVAAIQEHRTEHGPILFGMNDELHAKRELSGDDTILRPLSMREPAVRQALATQAMRALRVAVGLGAAD